VIVACSPDSGKNAGAILKEALAGTGGRGGGSSTMAQGSLPDPSVAEKLQRALGFEGAA
jgi:alanyl-tRNA synthetase